MKNLIPLLKVSLVLVLMISSAMPLTPVIHASSIAELEAQISKKRSELSELDGELAEASAALQESQSELNSALTDVDKINAQIDKIDAELRIKKLELEQVEQEQELKQLQKQDFEQKQDIQVKSAYQTWKSGNQNQLFNGSESIKHNIYNETITTNQYGGIKEIEAELLSVNKAYEEAKLNANNLQQAIEELEKQKQAAEQELNRVRSGYNAAAGQVSEIRGQQSQLQSQIEQLSKEQQELLEQEKTVINQNPGGGGNGATKELVAGEYYFSGTGRDLYQGHGIGMSQYGALGASLAGWDYKKIVNFYFPGAKVQKSSSLPAKINVDGVGQVNREDYVAGIGEVPDNSCEDLGVEFDPKNFWRCWPAEAIKAQVVIARTYGARRAGFIYKDTRSQVYTPGDKGKQWAASATADEVVIYNGGLADVYYSSDNNQGRGTANNDTVWSSFSGRATAIPYLRSVNDNSFAYRSNWTNWGWRSNSYSIKEIDQMLNWTKSSGSVSSSTRSFISSVKNDIGELKSLSFDRDPSQRVARVTLTGSKGSREVAGWLYKSIWNIWVGSVKPSGEADYIYSLTFFLNKK